MDAPPSRALLDWVSATIGAAEGLAPNASPCGWPQGPSRVWRIERADGTRLYLKRFSEERTRRQEITALERWVPALRDNGVALPTLVAASDPEHCAILVTEVPGEIAARRPVEEEDGEDLHRRAGAFLRRLHSLPHDDRDPIPLREALRLRLAYWLERGGDRLSHAEGRLARDLVGDGTVFDDVARVICHRDYQLRNWLVSGTGPTATFGVIDFEHARPDHPLVDFVRVRERALPHHPHWFDAFVAGYGGLPGAHAQRALVALSAIHGIGSVVWGTEHEDDAFVRSGHALLDRIATAS